MTSALQRLAMGVAESRTGAITVSLGTFSSGAMTFFKVITPLLGAVSCALGIVLSIMMIKYHQKKIKVAESQEKLNKAEKELAEGRLKQIEAKLDSGLDS